MCAKIQTKLRLTNRAREIHAKIEMRMTTLHAYDIHVENLFEIMSRMRALMEGAGVDYRVIGGMAIFLQVHERDPKRARLTDDVDVSIHRADLTRIANAAAQFGFRYRHAAGVDLLVDLQAPKTKSAVHFVFAGEKVRPDYLEAAPDLSSAPRVLDGVLLAPVCDLVRMKLTSFRLKDQVHIQDLDGARLITPNVESKLTPELKARLAQVRATR